MPLEGNLISCEIFDQLLHILSFILSYAYQLEEIKILWLVIDVVELKFTWHTAKKKSHHPEDPQKLAHCSRAPENDPSRAGLMILIDHVTWGNAKESTGL